MSKFDRFRGRQSSPKYKIKSGISAVDMLSGDVRVAHVGKTIDPQLIFTYGLEPGHPIMTVGYSGSGKSTLLAQLISNMKKEQEKRTSEIIPCMWFDIEKDSTVQSRLVRAMDITDEEFYDSRINLIKDTMAIESVFSDIIDICKTAIDEYKNKFIDYIGYGKSYGDTRVLGQSLPSVSVIIDSTSTMNTSSEEEKLDSLKEGETIDKAQSNTDAMIKAKSLKNAFQTIVQPVFDANLSLFHVAHFAEDKKMGMFDKKVRFHPMLEMGEKIKGGNGPIYVSDKIIKLKAIRFKKVLETYAAFGVSQITLFSFMKDRADSGSREFPLVMSDGLFNNDLSFFIYFSDKVYEKEYIANKMGRYQFLHYSVTHPNFYKYKNMFNAGKITEEKYNKFHDNLTIDTSIIPELEGFDEKKWTRKDFYNKLFIEHDMDFIKKWRIWLDAIIKIEIIKEKLTANVMDYEG